MKPINPYSFFNKRYSIEEILPNIKIGKNIKMILDENKVNVCSDRLNTFKEKGCACISCGRQGTHFRLQKTIGIQEKIECYHLGLWSDDNIQMTKDHIIPLAANGADKLSNLQTMCEKCNTEKGDKCTSDDIKNGELKEGAEPIIQDKTRTEPLRTINKSEIKSLKLDEKFINYRKDIRDYMMQYHINPYENISQDQHIIDAVKYVTEVYTKIIEMNFGKISGSDKLLIDFPYEISIRVIKEVRERFETKESERIN